MSIGIYKISSPSGKVYIGESINIERRFKYYQGLSQSKEQPKLYNSFKKYGINKHKFEIIEECNIENLKLRERYYQILYDSIKHGLNCTETIDQHKHLHNEATKEKLRSLIKGTLGSTDLSKCHRVYMFNHKGFYIDDFFSIREAVRKTKISYRKINRSIKEGWDANSCYFSLIEGRRLQLKDKKSRCVILIDENDNEELFLNQQAAAKYLGVNKTNILRCCNGDQFDVGSFNGRYRCRYVLMTEEIKKKWEKTVVLKKHTGKKTKKVRAENPSVNRVLKFNSVKEAAQSLSVTSGRICAVLKNPTNKAQGFYLSYI